MNKLVIATRGSALAMWQSEHIKDLIEKKHALSVELISMKTKGDVILDAPLAKIGGKGLFTKELEEHMLAGNSHLAVHSLKDVPVVFPKGLVLAAVSEREDERDAFVSEKYAKFSDLPKGAKVGTTSLRRKMQLLIKRPDLEIISLRGNVNTRLKKLKEGKFDAIILAAAGVKRLELFKEVRYFEPFGLDEMIPAMGQGVLGIECKDEPEILEILDFINDKNSLIQTTIERSFVERLEGGCQVPIGVNAQICDDEVKIRAIVGLPDGSEFIKDETIVLKSECEKLKNCQNIGFKFADKFIAKGAKELLARAEKMA